MGQQYLIDSNTVIDFLGGKLPASASAFMDKVVNDIPKVSVMTKIEVLGYNAPPDSYQLLTDFMNASLVLDLSNEIVMKTIVLRKAHRIKTPDAIIAATALVFNLTLLTGNTTDFKNVAGLQHLNPREIKK